LNHFRHSALVRVSAARLYDIITDIEAYPRIISQCKAAKIISRAPLADNSEEVTASLTLKLGPLKREFISRNIHTPNSLVKVNLQSGALHSLNGEWRLTEVDADNCNITCDFAFSLGHSALDKLAAKFLQGYLKHSIEHYIAYAERRS